MLTFAALLAPSPALACGGFFCNNVPVDQSGEDIVFAVDDDSGLVTVHVQISYEGAAEDFAWIVPVPEIPDLVLSTDRLFQELAIRTAPRFELQAVERFQCSYDNVMYDDYALSAFPPSSPSSSNGGVDVVAEQRVGPYDTVTLRAQTTDALLTWLQDNGFQLPSDLDPVLQPYVSEASYFVALKMAKDADVGQLAPLAMRYPGTSVSIPIQLTSIAAAEDMRLNVFVLGDSRAVPESYQHVQINELAVDWFQPWANRWEDAVTIAADEAGGHAFGTDYSGSSDVMADSLFVEGRFDIDALASTADAIGFFDELLRQGFFGDAAMLALFREFLPLPAEAVAAGVDEQSFYNCLSCFTEYVDLIDFDAAAFAAAIDERIVTPLRQTQAMLDAHPHLTRLTSSVSPVEMTVDPTFVFNEDMVQEVALVRKATLELHCGWGGDVQEAPRRLALSDGRVYELPSQSWFMANGMTEYEWLQQYVSVYAMIIEQTGSEGDPEVLFDYTDQAAAEAAALLDGGLMAAGCGCNGSAAPASAMGLLGLLGLCFRRRRS